MRGSPTRRFGSWTTKIARLPVSGGWHALVYTKQAEFGFEKDSFLLLAQSEEDAPDLHHRFLDKRSPLPPARLLGRLALGAGHRQRGGSPPPVGWECRPSGAPPKAEELREDLSNASGVGLADAAQGRRPMG